MRFVTPVLLCLLCAPLHADDRSGYANPELLIEAPVLRRELGEPLAARAHRSWQEVKRTPPLTLIDVRPQRTYAKGTLPEARHVDAGAWAAAFGEGTDEQGWSDRIGKVLRAPDSTVIVFDETVTPTAARVWWILRYWGVADVRILNGGVKQWRRQGDSLSFPEKSRSTVDFQAKPHSDRLATATEVLGCLNGDQQAHLIDTRSTQEVRAGYIPTASHSDWADYVDPKTGKMRPADELRTLLASAGFDKEQRNVAYCRSGARASVVAFAMELMGGNRVENYFGSWNEWSRLPAAPVAKP